MNREQSERIKKLEQSPFWGIQFIGMTSGGPQHLQYSA